MDKMKSAHVENHNMIEVHYDTANVQKRDWNLKLYPWRRFINIGLPGGGACHFPPGLKVCFGSYSAPFCVSGSAVGADEASGAFTPNSPEVTSTAPWISVERCSGPLLGHMRLSGC